MVYENNIMCKPEISAQMVVIWINSFIVEIRRILLVLGGESTILKVVTNMYF